MKRMILAAGAAALLLALGTAQAAPKEEVFARGKPLAEQMQRIEKEMNDGETYSELRLEDRSKVREALGRMRGVLDQYPNQHGIPEAAKLELYNDQQIVNTVLTQAREDSRQICTREKATGSNRSTTQCRTVAQRERDKANAERDLGNAQRGRGNLIN
ncbi:hypothetical protein [uncultured Stenotrophomonas sp.]|uniref:hypothetical protein n=1 Tax=uncultured Stenotrophomonas sp. TaxID=165438 RepID=UPI0028EDBFAF|nr:hypothetical protein [uncultured Stenotrophomonas sp.]